MMINAKRLVGLLAGAMLAVGLAACDDNTPTTDPTESEPTVSEEASEVPTLDPSDGITDDSKETAMTLTGTITAGVEAGCVLIEHEGQLYNLVGGDRQVLVAGATVEVSGTVQKGLMTTCQQGTPFKVDSVTVA